MATEENNLKNESAERQKDSRGSDKYGSAPGSSGPGQTRVHSHTPENRAGEMNPSAPTDATEGSSTNLADHRTGRSEPGGARGDQKASEATIKKPSAEKHEAA